jgi:arsenate reductase
MTTTFNVLFLCTGNSARSILAEVLLNGLGNGRFKAFSAGSQPNGRVNPFALEYIQMQGLPSEGLRSKSWDEFAGFDAPQFDFIITVCDNAAGEVCPIWPGKPAAGHWGIEDPAAVSGSDEDKLQAFAHSFSLMHRRISLLVDLSDQQLKSESVREELARIGSLREQGL